MLPCPTRRSVSQTGTPEASDEITHSEPDGLLKNPPDEDCIYFFKNTVVVCSACSKAQASPAISSVFYLIGYENDTVFKVYYRAFSCSSAFAFSFNPHFFAEIAVPARGAKKRHRQRQAPGCRKKRKKGIGRQKLQRIRLPIPPELSVQRGSGLKKSEVLI